MASTLIDYKTSDGILLTGVPRDTPESEVKARIADEREKRAVRNNQVIEERESAGLLDWGSLALALPGAMLRGAVQGVGSVATYAGALREDLLDDGELGSVDVRGRMDRFREGFEELVPPVPMTEGAKGLAGAAGEAIGGVYGTAAEMAGADPDVVEAARSESPAAAAELLASKYTDDPYLQIAAGAGPAAIETVLGAGVGAAVPMVARGLGATGRMAGKAGTRTPATPPGTAPAAAAMAARGGKRLQLGGPRKDVVEGMEVDPLLKGGLDELGIPVEDIPPSVAATNPRMQEILATGENVNPSTIAGIKATAFGEQLLVRGQELIDKYLYTPEKTLLGDKWINDTLVMEKELNTSAKKGYAEIDRNIRQSDQIETGSSNEFFDQLITDLGGVKNLPTKVKDVYDTFTRKVPATAEKIQLQKLAAEHGADSKITKAYQNEVNATLGGDNPTVGALELKRRGLRRAMDLDKGPYKDWDYDTQKKLYRAIGNDIQTHLDDFASLDPKSRTLADTYRESNKLYSKYKQVQESRLEIITGDFNRELIDAISGGIRETARGAPKKLTQLLDLVEKPDLPSKVAPGDVMDFEPYAPLTNLRRDVVKGALAEVMSKDGPLQTLQALKKYPAARKVIFRELDSATVSRMEAYERIGTIAQRSGNQKLTQTEYRQHLDEGGRIIDKVSNIAPGIGYTLAGYSGAVVGRGVQAAAHVNTSTKAVNRLLDNKKFHKFLVDAINNNPSLPKSTRLLEATKVYKDWADSLDPKTASQLGAAGGLAAWALSKDNE